MPKLWNDTIEAHRREVRDAILDATAALVHQQGLAAVTMSQIAEDTGIGRATLYKYFPDVESILVAWHERRVESHLEQLSQLARQTGVPASAWGPFSSNANFCIPAAPFGDMFDLNITGIGFDAHEGKAVHLLTRNLYNGAIFGSSDAIVAGGGFAFHFPRGLERFTYQEIFFFVDIDGDGKCAPGADHPGYTTTPGFNPTQNVPLDMQVMDNHMARSARGANVCVVMNGCQFAP